MNRNGTLKYHINEQHFAFNIWDFESARVVIDAAALVGQNVILQTSVSVFRQLSAKVFSDFVKEYSRMVGVDAWLNIDHCRDKDMLFLAIDSGWDMVMADGSSLPVVENISFVEEIIAYAHPRDVLVEAEVGQVKGIEDDIIVQQDAIASKDDIALFLNSSDIDFIAVAFGNAHGEYKVKPDLHYNLVEYTTSITDKPFVVHGGSGLSNEVLRKLISIPGVGKVNISTDLKQAYYDGIRKVNSQCGREGFQPMDANRVIADSITNMAISKMRLLKGSF